MPTISFFRPNSRMHHFLEEVVLHRPDLLPAQVYADDRVVKLVRQARTIRSLALWSIAISMLRHGLRDL